MLGKKLRPNQAIFRPPPARLPHSVRTRDRTPRRGWSPSYRIDHEYEQSYGKWVRKRIREGYNIKYSSGKTLAYKRKWEEKPYSDVWRVVHQLRMSPRLRREARRIWDPKRPVESLLRLLSQMFPLGQGGLIDHLGIGERTKDWGLTEGIPTYDSGSRSEQQPGTGVQTQPDTSYTSKASAWVGHRRGSDYSYLRKYRGYTKTLRMEDPRLPITREWAGRFARELTGEEPDKSIKRRKERDDDDFDTIDFNSRPCFHTIYVWKKTQNGWKKVPKRVPCSQTSKWRKRQTRYQYG